MVCVVTRNFTAVEVREFRAGEEVVHRGRDLSRLGACEGAGINALAVV